MKTRMIVVALVACGLLAGLSSTAYGVLIVDKYQVGDKDDFDNGDGDGTLDGEDGDLVTGEVVSLPWQTMTTPEEGNTDVTMKSSGATGVFDFTYNVAARTETLVSGLLRVTTWDVNYQSPTAWSGQPIIVKKNPEVVLPDTLSVLAGGNVVQVDEIPLSAAALALIEGGGEVHVIIGTPETLVGSDTAMIDYAELELQYEDLSAGESSVPEGSSAALLLSGLAGLLVRRKRS